MLPRTMITSRGDKSSLNKVKNAVPEGLHANMWLGLLTAAQGQDAPSAQGQDTPSALDGADLD